LLYGADKRSTCAASSPISRYASAVNHRHPARQLQHGAITNQSHLLTSHDTLTLAE
jgi:hypothetical protein